MSRTRGESAKICGFLWALCFGASLSPYVRPLKRVLNGGNFLRIEMALSAIIFAKDSTPDPLRRPPKCPLRRPENSTKMPTEMPPKIPLEMLPHPSPASGPTPPKSQRLPLLLGSSLYGVGVEGAGREFSHCCRL